MRDGMTGKEKIRKEKTTERDEETLKQQVWRKGRAGEGHGEEFTANECGK